MGKLPVQALSGLPRLKPEQQREMATTIIDAAIAHTLEQDWQTILRRYYNKYRFKPGPAQKIAALLMTYSADEITLLADLLVEDEV